MIELKVAEYCTNCLDFKVEQESIEYNAIGLDCQTDHILKCEHRDRCKAIKKYLDRKMG